MFKFKSIGKRNRVIRISMLLLIVSLSLTACGNDKENSKKENVEANKGPDKLIYCWGDSITQGMGYEAEQAYPGQLEKLLGQGYDVKNSGDGGEDSYTVMARMGAIKMYTKNEIAFAEGQTAVKIGTANDTGLCTEDGKNIMPTAKLGYEISCQLVSIGGVEYRLELRDFVWNTGTSPIKYECYLIRSNTDAVVIPEHTEASFGSAEHATKAYCNIVLVGANDTDNDANSLLEQYKKIVAGLGEGANYFVIIPYWGTSETWTEEDDAKFIQEFGEHAINFRKEAISNSVGYLKLSLTDEELNQMSLGVIPASLCYGNKNNVHLNEKGYEFLAYCIWQQGIELEYWSADVR